MDLLRGRGRIIVYEHHKDSREMMKFFLEGAGYEVSLASSEAELRVIAGTMVPDIVICEMDRWKQNLAVPKALEELVGKKTPVVGLAGHITPEYQAEAHDAGFGPIFLKPVSPEFLLRTLTILVKY